MSSSLEQRIEGFRQDRKRLEEAVGKVIVGQTETVSRVLTALFCGGNILLEGVPGLGKTLLVRTLGEALELDFKRIQFTPDLMPADVIGTHVLVEDEAGGRRFEFRRGPIFANLVLADEVNRATPKTQSALLEAMQEHGVSVASHTFRLEEPFFVLATQNPLEMEGTYPLPEAQLDRFFFKLKVPFPDRSELGKILERTTTTTTARADKVVDRESLLRMQHLVRDVPMASHVQDYVVRLVLATHPGAAGASPEVRRLVRYGSSPRGAQAICLASKERALSDGRAGVSFDDVKDVVVPALRHRVLLSFEGQAEGADVDQLLKNVVESVPREV